MAADCTTGNAARRSHGEACVDIDGDVTVVWLRGEHGASTAGALSDTMARAARLDDADLVVDLRSVEFMDDEIVGVIRRTRAALREQARELTLRAPSACARRLLDLHDLPWVGGPSEHDAVDAPWPGRVVGAVLTISAAPLAGRRVTAPTPTRSVADASPHGSVARGLPSVDSGLWRGASSHQGNACAGPRQGR